ncbi:MAG: transcription elongation factor GreA [Erysipelotrichaceae bacterium]|nr:transcription elongation factor GreA [Erysipelotrichaceae bacterium]
MEKEKIQLTKEGLALVQKEYDELVHVTRQEVISDLAAARAQGDLSENADYDAARDRQARVEARIRDLDYMLQNYEIIDDVQDTKGPRTIHLGSTVTLHDLDMDEIDTYTIVGSIESDPLIGKLSNETPLAKAILNHKMGDVVTVQVAEPYEVKILKVEAE